MVFKITGSVGLSGLAFFFETLPRFMYFPIAGIICDYLSPYKLLNNSQFIRFIVVLLGLIANYFLESVNWLILISAVVGILSTQGEIAREVMIPQVFKDYNLEKVLSFTQLSDQSGMVLAPFLAALLLNYIDWEIIVLITAFFFLFSDLSLRLWWSKFNFTFPIKNGNSFKIINDIKIAFSNILKLPKLIPLIILSFLINLILGTILASSAPIYIGILEESQNSYATLQILGIATTIIVLLTIARYSFPLIIMGALSFFFIGVGGILVGISSDYIIYIIGYILIVGFDKMFNIFNRTSRAKIIPIKDFGKTTGFIVLFNNISQPISGLLIAVYSNIINIQTLVLYISIFSFSIGSLIFVYFIVKKA